MDNKPIQILLIDDDNDQYVILRRYFRKISEVTGITFQFELEWVATYDKAMENIALNRHDVILIDYSLGKINGTKIILDAIDQGCKIPFILLTTHKNKKIDMEAMDAGAMDYLVKQQLDPALLERSIRYAMQQKQKELELEKLHKESEKNLIIQRELNNNLLQTTLELTTTKAQMDAELQQGRITQLSILPKAKTKLSNVNLATKYVPAETIGGDYFDFIDFREEKLGIFIADVTGHGISAALQSFMVSGLFKTFAPNQLSPARVLNDLNKSLLSKLQDDKFVTALYLIVDPQAQTITFSSGGHPPGYILRPAIQEIIPFTKDSVFLGIFEGGIAHYEDVTLELESQDKIIVYTDGIIETRNNKNKMFEEKRLEQLLLQYIDYDINDLLERIYSEVLAFSESNSLKDDVTLIGLEII